MVDRPRSLDVALLLVVDVHIQRLFAAGDVDLYHIAGVRKSLLPILEHLGPVLGTAHLMEPDLDLVRENRGLEIAQYLVQVDLEVVDC